MQAEPFIPETITVHLGRPDEEAENVTVSFPDYLKNVASSEIYPTWPENALRANIYAQASFALNRVYTEWYRSQGYDFDITNSTQFDQAYVQGRDIFENISRLVDDIFNSYLQRPGSVEPYFSQFCNGTTSTCDGLSQWGTVALAEQGLTPYEILTHYYGDDLNLVTDVPVQSNTPSYPGIPLRQGDSGNEVRTIQVQLNRISQNYPAIPKIYPPDGIFGAETEAAVREFQRVFNLEPDGIVGKSTWWRIAYIYTSVKKLAELNSEGVRLSEVSRLYPELLREGDRGNEVRILQYYLAVVAAYYPQVPPLQVDGIFGPKTREAVVAFQRLYGLEPDGVVGRQTWNELYRTYDSIVRTQPPAQAPGQLPVALYPGTVLRQGSAGESVSLLQQYLNYIAGTYPEIPKLPVTGYFGSQTTQAVRVFEQLIGLEPNGNVGPLEWAALVDTFVELNDSYQKQPGQYPGYELSQA